MFSPPVIAFQIAIAAIVLVGAYFGGKIVFIIAIILAVGWTLTMLGGPLVIVPLGTVVLAAWAGFHFFFSKPDTIVREGADRPVARVERQSPAPHRDTPDRQAVVSQPRLPTETTAAVQDQSSRYAAAPSTPPPAVQPREVSIQAAPARTVQEQPSAPQLSFNSRPLRLGQKYSDKQLERMFDFDYKGRAGIKSSAAGEIVLFSNDRQSSYQDVELGNTILFQGQNTGKGEQKLIYGNKKLYDAFTNQNTPVYLFKNSIYMGQYRVSAKPFLKNGRWFFPLSPK